MLQLFWKFQNDVYTQLATVSKISSLTQDCILIKTNGEKLVKDTKG
jgi:hypothetical protein